MDESRTAPEAPTLALIAKAETRYVVYCSHCGQSYDGEFGPALFPVDVLTEPGRYPFEDDGWQLDVDGRALVCPDCFGCVDYCEECGDEIHAWEAKDVRDDGGERHQRCMDGEDSATVVAAGSGGEEGR